MLYWYKSTNTDSKYLTDSDEQEHASEGEGEGEGEDGGGREGGRKGGRVGGACVRSPAEAIGSL